MTGIGNDLKSGFSLHTCVCSSVTDSLTYLTKSKSCTYLELSLTMDGFRDTVTGQFIRLITRNRLLRYSDEIYPESYRRTIVRETTLLKPGTNAEWSSSRNTYCPRMESQTAAQPWKVRRTQSSPAAPQSLQYESSQLEKSPPRPVHQLSASSSDTMPVEIDMSKIETQENGSDQPIVKFLEGDAANPQNWSFPKKCWVTGQICLLTTSIYIGSSIYTPGVKGIMEQSHVGQVTVVLGLILFVIGYGIGPMFLAGLAEAPPIGRTPVYVFSVVAFTLFNLGVYWAKNIGMLLAFRFITGFVASPVIATGGASLADIWSPITRMYAIGIWGLFAVLGPVPGPVVGTWAAEFRTWRWTILELILLSALVSLLLIFCLPETSSASILCKRTRRLQKAFDDPTLKCEADIEMEQITKQDLLKMILVLPFRLGFFEPILLATNLYLGLVYAILYCWFEAFPLVYNGAYGMSLGISGLPYISLMIGAWVSAVGYFYYLRRVTEKDLLNGSMTPEKRMPVACFGAFCLPICMFWFGRTAKEDIHWISPTIAAAFFAIGACLLFNAILNYQADAYPK